MNSTNPDEKPVWHIGIIFVVACLLFTALVAWVKFSTPAPAIDADRSVILTKALKEIRATEAASLSNPGWVDESRGIVRLPIETALQLAVGQGQGIRADLIARAAKASSTAPKVIQKKSAFE